MEIQQIPSAPSLPNQWTKTLGVGPRPRYFPPLYQKTKYRCWKPHQQGMILCRLLYPCSHHTRQKVEICQSHSRNPSTCPVTTTADVTTMWLVYSSLLCISLYFHPKTTFWTLQFSLAHLKHIVISFISSFFLFCTVNLLKNLSN